MCTMWHRQVADAIGNWVDNCGGAFVATKEDILNYLQEEVPDAPRMVREHFALSLRRQGLKTASYRCGSDRVRLVYDPMKFPSEELAIAHVEEMGCPDSVHAELEDLDEVDEVELEDLDEVDEVELEEAMV